MENPSLLEQLRLPGDIKDLSLDQLNELCDEIRNKIINTVSKNGGHLASNLGVVELTVALHYVFDLPQDQIVWDVGHQCYTHKILTGRLDQISTISKENGLSGFQSVVRAFTTPLMRGTAAPQFRRPSASPALRALLEIKAKPSL